MGYRSGTLEKIKWQQQKYTVANTVTGSFRREQLTEHVAGLASVPNAAKQFINTDRQFMGVKMILTILIGHMVVGTNTRNGYEQTSQREDYIWTKGVVYSDDSFDYCSSNAVLSC